MFIYFHLVKPKREFQYYNTKIIFYFLPSLIYVDKVVSLVNELKILGEKMFQSKLLYCIYTGYDLHSNIILCVMSNIVLCGHRVG